MELAPELALTKSFTPQQRAFVEHVSEGLDLARSAELAGYSSEHASTLAWQLMRQPAIIAAVHLETGRKLAMSAPTAIKVLREFMQDETCDKRIRLASAKTLLDRAGWIAPKAIAAGSSGEKPLNDMSTTELRALADKLEGELADRAKPVSSASAAPIASQAIEDII